VLRSIPTSWRISPPVGKIKASHDPRIEPFPADFRQFPRLARAMLKQARYRRRSRRDRGKTKVQETEMFNFDRFAKVATAAVGALVLSTLSIVAAVGPVRATGLDRTEIAFVQHGTQAHG
jgi:hypothetical protein